MEEDKELTLVVEKFLTKRVYAPRVKLSDNFDRAMKREILSLMETGINSKRILSAITFRAEINTSELKKTIFKKEATHE
tara:strand:- start:185 stop:421 length:237 start_codon:yes stop_codon:yes gene_type:complete